MKAIELPPDGAHADLPLDWVVTRVVHRLDTGVGYTCELEAERPLAD